MRELSKLNTLFLLFGFVLLIVAASLQTFIFYQIAQHGEISFIEQSRLVLSAEMAISVFAVGFAAYLIVCFVVQFALAE